ncbi:PQQ-dependent sugar dehydrogenase [Actinoplanes sp. M2I2]|uniref:PQQ-dependent sugar dehydrogenase n=1 Tax=Actinoplanes sp. M2I2 TaxID=1734444 RepID=UPI002022518E|nr:PQQ-dependent sugar dehydrogenase [Actinoplanes sp. M2I2]
MRTATRWRTGRTAVTAVGVILAMLVTALTAGTPSASAASGEAIVGVASGRCLDVTGNVETAKTGVNLFDCQGQANQGWTFTPAGELRVFDGRMCLDVEGQKTTAPARAQIFGCTGQANQKWRITAAGTIVGIQSGLCLDVDQAGTANSVPVNLWTCNGQDNQKWRTTLGGADTQPPTVPGRPRVSDLTCDAVTLAWDASTDNVGVAFYDIYHDGQQMTSVSGTTLSTRLTVVPGAQWGLYVNARDSAGNVSQASTTVPITAPQCQPDTQAPTAPRDLAAAVSGTAVTLRWTAATDNVGVRAYEISRDGTRVATVSGSPPATTFIDSGLRGATAYRYQVLARDAQNNASGLSNAVSVTTGAACSTAICQVTEVYRDTDIPWGLVALADGTVLYNRRDAHDIVRLDPATGTRTTLGSVPGVESTDGEGGLMGLAVAPTFETDHWLYIMHTSPTDNRIVRIKLEGGRLDLTTRQTLLTGILRNKFHDGGRLRFGPDGKLYAATGDAQNGDYAQNRDSLNGKILRLNPDGSVPSDNPFGNYVWSYGHRNPQGIAFDANGRLWEQEFGNSVMDETNLITRGGNYGWPACEGTSGTCGVSGYIAPKQTYSTANGSCSGLTVVGNAVYIACARGERLNRLTITANGDLTGLQSYLTGQYGRFRTVEPARDGGLWLTTTNGGDKDSVPNNTDGRVLHVTLG